jgi:hypothetical protein
MMKIYFDFLNYFKKTYFGFSDQNNVFKKALFPKENWSCFFRVLNRIPRTNNNAEYWHKNLNEVFSISKPNIAVFITALIDNEELNIIELTRFKDGGFSFRDFNIIRDEKIRIIFENNEFLSNEKYFKALLKFYSWDFE